MIADRESESDPDSDSEAEEEGDSDDADRQALPGLQVKQSQGQQRSEGGSKPTQTSKLYTEPGQFNPKAARAEKKRRKKQKRVSLGDDFDFAEAFADEVVIGDEREASADEGSH